MATNTFNSDHFDLKDWNLTLPVDSSGGTSGTAATIENLIGYESRYFYDATDYSMIFDASVSGATTKNSSYPRSELRELKTDGSLAGWKLTTGGTMTATLKVDKMPTLSDGTVGKAVIGQIHGGSNELVRLYWDNGTVYFKNDRSGSDGKEHQFLLKDSGGNTPRISFGEAFSYKIDAHGSTLKVDVYADGHDYSSTTTINSVWQSDTLYFKAGLYLGENASQGATGEGQDSFYGLDFGHTAGSGLGGLTPIPGPTTTPPPTTTITVTGTSSGETLNADAVINSIVHGNGGNDKVYGHDGNDMLYGDGGNDIVSGGNGDDRVLGGSGSDKLTGGAGADTFVFKSANVGDGSDTISDFSASQGDKLDVSSVLAGHYDPAANALSDFVRLSAGSTSTILSVDMDGKGAAHGWTQIATLSGGLSTTLGTTDVNQLVHDGGLFVG